jgi:hypothetical protein
MRLFDLPAPRQSLWVQDVGQQCRNEIEQLGTPEMAISRSSDGQFSGVPSGMHALLTMSSTASSNAASWSTAS